MGSERRRRRALLVGVFALCALAWWLYLGTAGSGRAAPRAAEGMPLEPPVKAERELATAELAAALVPEGEGARVAQQPGAPERVGARPEPLGADEGFLQVRVLALEDGQPLAGAKLRLETPAGASLAREHRRRARGTHAESLESDAEGRAAFRVPAREPFVLHAQFDAPPGRSARLAVRPLEPGQYRTLVVDVFGAPDRTWCARVVDGESGSAIPGARAALVKDGRTSGLELSLDWAGATCLELSSHVESSVRASAPGYTEQVVPVESGHASAFDEQRIELLRSATLSVRVYEIDGRALAGCRVRVGGNESLTLTTFSGSPRPGVLVNEGLSDVRGLCAFHGLPAHTPLFLVLEQGQRRRLAQLEEGLVPGEVRTLAFTLGNGCTLAGQALDQEHVPLAGLELWLVPGTGPRLLSALWSSQHVLRTTTDEGGRFRIDDVSSGAWRLGPAPRLRFFHLEGDGTEFTFEAPGDSSTPPERLVAPLAQAVVIADGERTQELLLRAWRGLYIRGRVVDPEGGPAPHATVLARCDDLEAHGRSYGDDGTFELGPLVPGEYELVARTGSERRSRPLRASAGSEGVELVLEAH